MYARGTRGRALWARVAGVRATYAGGRGNCARYAVDKARSLPSKPERSQID